MKLRKKDPWKPAREYSKDLSGLTINLLVEDIKLSIHILQKIIKAKIIYQDPDFAAIEGFGSRWCLHSYHTYDSHPFMNIIRNSNPKGVGIELRVIGCTLKELKKEQEKKIILFYLIQWIKCMAWGYVTFLIIMGFVGCHRLLFKFNL